MDKNQIGFVKECCCQMNIKQLLQELQKYKSKDKIGYLLNFKTKYNTIKKERLFEILREK